MKIRWYGNFKADDSFWLDIINLLNTNHYKANELRSIVIKCSKNLDMPTFSSWDERVLRSRIKMLVYELKRRYEDGDVEAIKKCLSTFVIADRFSIDDLNGLLKRTHLRCVLKQQGLVLERNTYDYCMFSKDNALAIIERFLRNYVKYEYALIKKETHKSAGIDKDTWGKIIIKNEYDIHRIIYAWLKPLFPTVRTEVVSDSGYVGMRSDIFLGDYSTIIEIKCTRFSMSEKKLIEELSSDVFNYKAENIFLFIYDLAHIVKNPEAFEKSFLEKSREDLRLRAFVTIPR